MHSRLATDSVICAALVLLLAVTALAQGSGAQNELSALQRLDVMHSKLDGMQRSLTSAISAMEPQSAGGSDRGQRSRCRIFAGDSQ